MIRSRYTLYLEDYPRHGTHLLYNTLNQGMVEVDTEAKEVIEALPIQPDNPDSISALESLREMGFLVDDPSEDEASIEGYFGDITDKNDTVDATVMTTYACNFACTYCVEEGVKASLHMDDATARDSAKYILREAKRRKAKNLYLNMYGGEPLMNLMSLRIVAGEVQRGAAKAKMQYGMTMTSNGALLTPMVVDELVTYGLVGVKVTIDGDRKRHNIKRPYLDGRGSYDKIIENITYAVDKIGIDIGCNFDDENIESFPRLLEDLHERGIHEKIHRITFKPISETPHDREMVRSTAEIDCVYGDPDTAIRSIDLQARAIELGFPVAEGVGVNICGITLNSANFVIDPVGKLFKCCGFVGHDRFVVGDIWRGERSQAAPGELWKRCKNCVYVPLCGDSCMFGSFLRFGDEKRLNCQKDFVEYIVRENLKSNYRNDQTV